MSRLSIIIFFFFYAKISRTEESFSKNFGKFSAAADREKKIEISQPPPPPRKTSAYTSNCNIKNLTNVDSLNEN
jgi:hypothetical protein